MVYLLTGSVVVGGAVALVEPAVNTLAFYFHERLWSRWDRRQARHARAGAGPEAAQAELLAPG